LANAAAYNKSAADEAALLDIVIKNRETTLAASNSIKSVCDTQIASYKAQIDKANKFIEAIEKGDPSAAAKQKTAVDQAKTDKAELEKKTKKLNENAASVTAQIEALKTMQDDDKKRKVLIDTTIDHNNKIIAGASGKPMIWPPAVV
jgi:predicted  nucleic acid-binding Zn-ribbon protein